MSNDNQNPPSIDDLINGEFASSDDNSFNLDELDISELGADDGAIDLSGELNLDNTADNASGDPMSDDDAFFAELNKISHETDTVHETLASDTHAHVDTSANTAFDAPVNPLVEIEQNIAEAAHKVGDTISEEVAAGTAAVAGAAAAAKKGLFGKKDKGDKPAKSGGLFAKKEKTPSDKKGGLFGAKTKEPKTPKPTAKTPKAPKAGNSALAANPNLLKYIILGAIVAIALLVGAWFLSQEPAPAPTPPAPPKAAPAPQPAPPPAPAETAPTETATDGATTETAATDGATPTEELPKAGEMIDADAIVNAEIPTDEALVKEEIHRLQDKDEQFKEQAKMIDEQLGMMKDLEKAKEERIRLLEEQIAQLESQKK